MARVTVYSVSQVNSYIRQLFSTDLLLTRLYVRGEISNCKYHSSGHIYFSLKDEQGQIRCVMFASHRRNLNFRLENGQKIIAFGQVSIYERDGSYQLYVNAVRLDGVGALYERFEALKRELKELGLFDPMYKQPIPHYIHTLGVVTAPTGAAVRDIINVSKRRNPGIQIILYPALVQGDGAAESIVRGIRMLDDYGVDTILVGRGGGSIEDLWAFNEEIVARAIFDCRTPVISAVGHETDTTIADFTADLRAPTPSAGAELAVDDMKELSLSLEQTSVRQRMLMKRRTDYDRQVLRGYALKLQMHGPAGRLRDARQFTAHSEERLQVLLARRITEGKNRLAVLESSLRTGIEKSLRAARHRAELLEAKISAMSPQKKLDGGFAYLEDGSGRPVRSVDQLNIGEAVRISLRDGIAKALVEETEKAQLT